MNSSYASQINIPYKGGAEDLSQPGAAGKSKARAREASQKKVAASQKSKARPLRAPPKKGRDLPEKQKSKASCEKSKRDPLIFLLPACGRQTHTLTRIPVRRRSSF